MCLNVAACVRINSVRPCMLLVACFLIVLYRRLAPFSSTSRTLSWTRQIVASLVSSQLPSRMFGLLHHASLTLSTEGCRECNFLQLNVLPQLALFTGRPLRWVGGYRMSSPEDTVSQWEQINKPVSDATAQHEISQCARACGLTRTKRHQRHGAWPPRSPSNAPRRERGQVLIV